MNIAFPAFLIFLFILPGFIFTHAFYQVENIPLGGGSLTRKVLISISATFMLWLVFYFFLQGHIDFTTLLVLAIGGQSDQYIAVIKLITSAQIAYAIFCLVVLYTAAYGIGFFFRVAIPKFKLDKKYPFCRIDSPWYYLFTLYDCNNDAADGVRIAAVTEIAKMGYLYIGWLDKFYLDSSGVLDRIVLVGARRRPIQSDKSPSEADINSFNERFYPIDGDYFILKYSEIKSLNVQYLKVNDVSALKNREMR